MDHAAVLDVWMDVVCPWCHLGQHRLDQALARHEQTRGVTSAVTVRYHPFQLQPGMRPGGEPRREFFARVFGSMERADAAWARVADLGAAEGLEFRFDLIEVEPNTLDAHRLIAAAQTPERSPGLGSAVVHALAAGYFRHGADIGQPETLLALAATAGLPEGTGRQVLADPMTAQAVRAEAALGRELGISSVPTYQIGVQLIPGALDVDQLGQVLAHVATDPRAHG